MDELDRLYKRLVLNIRSSFPELLTRPFEVAQIYQQIVPYRTNRRELGYTTNDEFELALCQLLSGSRGLLNGERDMQDSLRRELDSPSPDLSAYRAYATGSVSLTAEALRDASRFVTPEGARPSTSKSWPPASPAEQAVIASRATESVDAGAPNAQAPAAPVVAPIPVARPAPRAQPAPVVSALESPMPSVRQSAVRPVKGEECRYCGSGLPEGRGVVFCPGCGHNLTVQHCPACNTELEVGWKFCVTCGRDTR